MPQDNTAIALFKPRLISYLCLGSAAATFSFLLAASIGVLDFNLRHIVLDLIMAILLLIIGLLSLKKPDLAVRLFRVGLISMLIMLIALAYVDPQRQTALFFIGLVIIGAFITINTAFGMLISAASIVLLLWLSTKLSITTEMMTYISLFLTTCMLLGWIVSAFYQHFLEEIRQYEQQLANQAYTDELTGLLNRHGFLPEAEQLIRQYRHNGQPLTLAVIDLDHFKRLNDRYGHIAGDAALRHVAIIMQDTFQQHDALCGRMGGDELMVMLPGMPLERARHLLVQFAEHVAMRPVIHEGRRVTLSLSVGATELQPEQDRELDDLIRRADRALYMAKSRGRNRVYCEFGQPHTSAPTRQLPQTAES